MSQPDSIALGSLTPQSTPQHPRITVPVHDQRAASSLHAPSDTDANQARVVQGQVSDDAPAPEAEQVVPRGVPPADEEQVTRVTAVDEGQPGR